MNRLLYPLIASALITIAPFLLTFEKGQDIVRGIFGYSEFALLLLFAWVKGAKSKAVRIAGMAFLAIAMLAVAFMDLSNLLAIKGWDMGWRVVVPFATCGLAIAMMWKVPAFKFSTINLVVFVALVTHLATLNYYAAQPLAQFPVIDYLDRTAPKPVERKKLPDDFAAQANVVVMDSATITHHFADSSRSNVVILVESWGIPLNQKDFAEELSIFRGANLKVAGVHSRMYSRTRTAEREDLIHSMAHDSVTRRRDTTFLPKVYSAMGYKTAFLFGGDSLEQFRYKYIRNVGFENVIWGSKEERLGDSVMLQKVDSLLSADSLNPENLQKQFVAFTTGDTRFPLPGFKDPYSGSVKSIHEAYATRLESTLRAIASLAQKHPDVRFVVQGDHDPILSPLKFQEFFYKRWVPFVVLN